MINFPLKLRIGLRIVAMGVIVFQLLFGNVSYIPFSALFPQETDSREADDTWSYVYAASS